LSRLSNHNFCFLRIATRFYSQFRTVSNSHTALDGYEKQEIIQQSWTQGYTDCVHIYQTKKELKPKGECGVRTFPNPSFTPSPLQCVVVGSKLCVVWLCVVVGSKLCVVWWCVVVDSKYWILGNVLPVASAFGSFEDLNLQVMENRYCIRS
jgi:hypothetical protein